MKVITEKQDLRKKLKKLSPSRIAVGYIGAGWRQYIEPKHLHDFVVSPTLGSNPNAIHDIANTIGWDKIHFLDQLHSKIYLSDYKALVGSANLSDNALAQGNLSEVMILLKKKKALTILGREIDSYIKSAKKLYPNKAAKIARLTTLEKEWKKAKWNDLTGPPEEAPEIHQLSDEQLANIHVAWYIEGDYEFNFKEVEKKVNAKTEEGIEEYFKYYLNFHEDDVITEGDWILLWHSKKDGSPRKYGEISWMQAHEVISQGVINEAHTKLVGEVSKYNPSCQPFLLTKEIKEDIHELLTSKKYPSLLRSGEETWKLKPAKSDTKLFLSDLQDLQLVKK